VTVDWKNYQKCPVCGAPIGEACAAMTCGFVTEAVRITVRDEPHSTRKLTAAAARAGGDR
jgi:hypothetical protein